MRDTLRLIEPLLAMAGVLTVVQAAPRLTRRLTAAKAVPSGLPALGLCLVIAWTAVTLWQGGLPGGPGIHNPPKRAPINQMVHAVKVAPPTVRCPRVPPHR